MTQKKNCSQKRMMTSIIFLESYSCNCKLSKSKQICCQHKLVSISTIAYTRHRIFTADFVFFENREKHFFACRIETMCASKSEAGLADDVLKCLVKKDVFKRVECTTPIFIIDITNYISRCQPTLCLKSYQDQLQIFKQTANNRFEISYHNF